MTFTQENTFGYTDVELEQFNEEWEQRAAELGYEYDSDEYQQAEKRFFDEVTSR